MASDFENCASSLGGGRVTPSKIRSEHFDCLDLPSSKHLADGMEDTAI